MLRRVEIARALVHEPKVFFLDEPTTGLDPVSRTNVWEMLQRIKRERDLTVLITTHYMDEDDKLCDRIAIVDHGALVAPESPPPPRPPPRPSDARGQDGRRRDHARRQHLPDRLVERPGDDAGPDAARRGVRRHGARPVGAEPLARRRVRPLHRPRAA